MEPSTIPEQEMLVRRYRDTLDTYADRYGIRME
jgi:hypothetical protein